MRYPCLPIVTVLRICLLLIVSSGSLPAKERTHPWLFLTPADIERTRQGVGESSAFAELARQLAERAATNRVEDLPPLERQWWAAAKQQSWKETYPAIFHHTWLVPSKWAELARTCAEAQRLSPSPHLLAKAKSTLLALSDYTFEFDHYDVGMNYTVWAVSALETYDLLYPEFTTAERARLDAFFERYLAALRKSDDYWIEHEPGGHLNNHYAWHKLGLAMVGLFYERPELVERALHGPKGVDDMLVHGFKDDGLWLEGSIPYQFAETAPLVILARLLNNAHYPQDLFHYLPQGGYQLQSAYDALIPLLFPDRTLPPLGDAYARRPHVAEHPDWEALFCQFRSPTYAWLLRERPTRTPEALFWGVPVLPPAAPPPQPSKLWPEMGYVALRSDETTNYWSGHGWSVFATYSGQTVHDHADKLSVMLFAEGHLWLGDCEARSAAEHGFSSAVQNTLNRETLCHNTLLVDGHSQRRTGQRLELREYEGGPAFKSVTLGDLQGRLYEGVRQLRTLIVCSNQVLDFFQVTSATPHEFTWITHVDGEPAGGTLPGTNAFHFPAGAPWSWLHEPQSAGVTNTVWECFSDDQHTLRLDLLSDGPAQMVHCGFPRNEVKGSPPIPMRLFSRQGTNAWFLAVYRMVRQPGESARLSVRQTGPGEAEITLRQADGVYRYQVPSW